MKAVNVKTFVAVLNIFVELRGSGHIEASFIVPHHTGPGGNKPAHDDIFFQPPQRINRSGDTCIGKHLGSLLK
jgi:hypothetical protein